MVLISLRYSGQVASVANYQEKSEYFHSQTLGIGVTKESTTPQILDGTMLALHGEKKRARIPVAI